MKRPRYMVLLNTFMGFLFVLNTAITPANIQNININLPLAEFQRLFEAPFAATITVQAQPSMVPVGNTFQALVQVSGLTEPLSGFQLDLTFDSALVELVSAQPGPFLAGTGRQVICAPPAYPGAGSVRFACASSGAQTAPQGSGTLAQITLRARATGTSGLTPSAIKLAGAGAPPASIPSSAQAGHVTINGSGSTLFIPVIVKNASPGGAAGEAAREAEPAIPPVSEWSGIQPGGYRSSPAFSTQSPGSMANNCHPADLDCDQDIDSNDLSLAAGSWNCAQGDPCFTAAHDLDHNNLVDVFDLAWVGNEFDDAPPVVTINNPGPGQVLSNVIVTVNGSFSDKHPLASLKVNEVNATITGSTFSAQVTLAEGDQVLTVVAIDSIGQVGIVERSVHVDLAGPQISIVEPKDRQSVYTLTPFVSIQYGDYKSAVNVTSLQASIQAAGSQPVNIKPLLSVTSTGASGTLNSLSADTIYTLTVTIADTWGNPSTVQSSFYVPINPGSLTKPVTSANSGWISGVVYDSITCDAYLSDCQGLPGAQVTLSQVDPVMLAIVRAQRAELVRTEGPQEPMQIPAEQQFTTPVAGTVVTGPDGFFTFPVAATGQYWVRVEKSGYTYGQREVEIALEHGTATNNIYLTPLDPAMTTCGSAGCTHTSSDGEIQLSIPAGAVSAGQAVDVNATNFDQVEYLPSGDLPEGTWETYAFNLGGDSEYTFNKPVTVRLANQIGFPPGTPVPLGYWNQAVQQWEHAGTGVVDASGQWIEMQVMHFSNYDCNDPITFGKLEPTTSDETEEEEEEEECEDEDQGCFVNLKTGRLAEEVKLPAVDVLGEQTSPVLLYNTERVQPDKLIDIDMSVTLQEGVITKDYIQFELYINGVKTDHFVISTTMQSGELGRFRYLWDGRDAQGQLLPPGIYDYRAKFGIPYQAQYCYALGGIFGNPPDCVNGATGIFVDAIQEHWVFGTVAVNPQIGTPLGDGWVLNGLQRLYQDQVGRILITDGSRTTEYYHPGKDQVNLLNQAAAQAAASAVITEPQSTPALQPEPPTSPLHPKEERSTEGLLPPQPAPVELPAPPPLDSPAQPLPEPPAQEALPEENAPPLDEPPFPTQEQIPPETPSMPEIAPSIEGRIDLTAGEFVIASNVGGNIITHTTWTLAGSPYILVSDVRVVDGITLTIDPGVQVIFNQNRNLYADGVLKAIGTPTQPITFTAAVAGASDYWGVIQVGGGANLTDSHTSQLSYVTIEGGGSTNVANLYLYQSHPAMNHLTIQRSGNRGLYSFASGGWTLDTATIANNVGVGIELSNSGGDTLNNITVQNNGSHGLYLNTYNGNLTIDNANITGNATYGIFSAGGNNTPTLQNSTITGNASAGRLHPNAWLINNNWSGNGVNEIEWTAGTVSHNQTWNNQVPVYRVVGDITASDGVTLTVSAGQTVYFAQNTGLIVNGNLLAVGTVAQPIIFTAALADAIDYWDALQIGGGSNLNDSNASQLSYVTIDGAGAINTGGLYLNRSKPTMDHLTIRRTGADGLVTSISNGFTLNTALIENNVGDGIQMGGVSGDTLSNVTILNNTGHGVHLNGVTGNVTITNASIQNNTGYGIFATTSTHLLTLQNSVISGNASAARLHPNTWLVSNSWSNNGANEIEWNNGTITHNQTWDNQAASYRVLSNVTAADGITLTISAGGTVFFAQNISLLVNGNLRAIGTPTQPITFTAAVAGASDYWGVLQVGGGNPLTDSNLSQLSYVTIDGGGQGNQGGLYLNQSRPIIDHLTIRRSGSMGLQASTTGNLTLNNALIEDNIGPGIQINFNSGGTLSQVTLRNNGGHGLYINSVQGNLTLTDALIQNNAGYGIYNNSGTHVFTLQNSTISGNGSAARLHPNAWLINNTWSSNGANEIEWNLGTITHNQDWGEGISNYRMLGNVRATDGVTLTVKAGTTVYNQPTAKLTVEGNMRALGTPAQPITFTAAVSNTSGYWNQMIIGGGTIKTDSGSSELSYVTIEGAGTLGQSSLEVNETPIAIDHLQIRNGGGNGLVLYRVSNSTVDYVTVSNHQGTGIHINEFTGLVLGYATVHNNAGDGISVAGPGTAGLIHHANVNANGGYGLNHYNTASSLTVQDSVFTSNASATILVPNTKLVNNTWTGNGANVIEWREGQIDQNKVWDNQANGYKVLGTVTVSDGVTLTVEADVRVMFAEYADLYVNGVLKAVGTPTQPITFTASVSNTRGYWGTVQIAKGIQAELASSELSYLTIQGGGFAGASLFLWETKVNIDHVNIRDTDGTGISAYNVQPLALNTVLVENSNSGGVNIQGTNQVNLSNVTIRNHLGNGLQTLDVPNLLIVNSSLSGNGGYGIYYSMSDYLVPTAVSIQDTLISGNGEVAYLPVNSGLQNLTIINNLNPTITFRGGTIAQDSVWIYTPGGIERYSLVNDVTVADNVTLTIQAGAEIIMNTQIDLDVNGALVAGGTASAPITFRPPIPGTQGVWGHIAIGGGSVPSDSNNSQLSFVNVLGGGIGGSGLHILNSTPTLDHLTIKDIGHQTLVADGILVNNSPGLKITTSNFINITGMAVKNLTPAVVVDARNNYWGAPGGPFHATLNPGGLGEPVSDGVMFDPWLEFGVIDMGVNNMSPADYSHLEYDAFTSTYTRVYPDGTMVHFNLDGTHDYTLTPDGNKTIYTYNPDQTLATMGIIPNGKSSPPWIWTFQYTGGKLTGITDPAGRTTTLEIDAGNHLAKVTFPDGSARRFTYNAQGLMTQQSDPNSEVTRYTYDSYGRIATVTEPTRPVYDQQSGQVQFTQEVRHYFPADTSYPLLNTSPAGNPINPAPPAPLSDELIVTAEYGDGGRSGTMNSWGFWLEQTDGIGRTTTYTRDARNNLTGVTLPDGSCERYTYDGEGNVLTRSRTPVGQCAFVNPPGTQTWTYTYEAQFNQVKTETDPLGNTTTFTYDYELGQGQAGRLVRITHPAVPDQNGNPSQPVEQFTYNAWGQIATETDPRGVVTQYLYTQGIPSEASSGATPLFAPGVNPIPGLLTRIIEDASGLKRTTIFKDFEATGNPRTIIAPNGTATTFTYDLMGRMAQQTDILGRVRRYTYDGRGDLRKRVYDYTADGVTGRNVTATFDYDAYDNTLSEQILDGLNGREQHFSYDINRRLATVTDGEGYTTRYRYDSANQKIAQVDALGFTTSYTYTLAGQLQLITLPDGSETHFEYDSFHRRVKEIVDAGGLNLTTIYTYDALDRVLSVTDPAGVQTCYTYDALGRMLSQVEDCGGLNVTTQYRYDLVGNQVRQVNPKGAVTLSIYDNLNRLITDRRDPTGLNQVFTYQYDQMDNLVRRVDPRGVVDQISYDALARPVSQIVDASPGGLNLTTSFTYDRLDNPASETDPLIRTTTFSYNAFGELLRQVDPLGNTTTHAYDRVGNRARTTDPSGRSIDFNYDGLGRLIRLVNVLGDDIQYEYDSRGRLKRTIDPNNQPTTFLYDPAGRMISETNALGETVQYSYDLLGRLTAVTDPLNHTRTMSYDPLGRQLSETLPTGEKTVMAYDAASNLLTLTKAIPPGGVPADGQTTTFTYDALNRRISEKNPLNQTTQYTYNLIGDRLSVTDPNNHTFQYAFDNARRLVQFTDPLGRKDQYTYDAAGQLIAEKDGNNSAITHSYDLAGRLTVTNHPNGTNYTRSYDPSGRVLTVTGTNTNLTFAYDAIGRLQSVTDLNMGKTTSYSYDAAGNQLTLSGTDSLLTNYTYDAAGRLKTITSGADTFSYAYDAAGRVLTKTLPNSGKVLYSYDNSNRVTQVEARRPNNSVAERQTYTFDSAGNRKTMTLLNADQITYSYNKANQLTGEQRTGGLAYQSSYSYDPSGNRTQMVKNGVTTNYTYDAANQLLSESGPTPATYGYDNAGNMVSETRGGQTTTYTYDPAGRLTAVGGPGVASSYQYDAFDRRVSETTNGATIRYLYDQVTTGATVMAEYNANMVLSVSYILSLGVDGQVARRSGGTTHYFLRDSLNSVRGLLDSAGNLANRYEYDGFGQVVQSSEAVANPYRYAGRRWEAGAGLYDSRARFYDASTGRFIQPDPMGILESPNLYQYALNNPVNRIDPLGWSSEECNSINYELQVDIGSGIIGKIKGLLSRLPGAPEVEVATKIGVEGKSCGKCCEKFKYMAGDTECEGCRKRATEDSLTIKLFLEAEVKYPIPGTIKIKIATGQVKIGIEAYAKLTVGGEGTGAIDQCAGTGKISVCANGELVGGIRGGLIEWPFEVIKLQAYVYGEVSGSCKLCVQYDKNGLGLGDTGCQACVGYGVVVKFGIGENEEWEYKHEDKWCT